MIATRTLTAGLGLLIATLALMAVAVTMPRGTTAAIPSAAGACVDGWREVPIPDSAFLSTPFDVVTRNGKEAWILGGTNSGVLALRYNGSAWKKTAGGTSGHRGLVGGSVVGDKKVLGVGYYRENTGNGQGSLKPISGKIVDSAWKNRWVPDPPGPRASLTDVTSIANGGAWAVGTRLQNGRLRAYALRWTGSRWSMKDPWAGTGSGLLGVERSPSGSVWAVGWKESTPGRPRPYIVKRASSGWKVIKPASLATGSAVLTDVSFRAGSDGYTVGYFTAKGSDKPRAILEHWDGEQWSMVDLPWSDDFGAMPRSVSVSDDGQVWIAGTQPANDKREPRGFIAHLEGGAWEISLLDVPSDIRSEVMAVAATDRGAVAAASVGASLLVLKSCDDVSAALAASGKAGEVTRGKVSVGNMKKRRESVSHDMDHLPENPMAVTEDIASDDGDPSLAGTAVTAVTLASPVKHDDFWVGDRASESGLKQWTKTYRGFAADFDGNGWRDVFYSRHGTILPRLAMNGPGGFSNAPTGAFSSVDRHGCDKGDVDHDGNKDILCSSGASRGKAIKRHELSMAPNKPKREVLGSALGISDPLGRGRHVALFRLDEDPYPEVFIANAPDRDDGMPGYNRFYRNEGGSFVPAPGVGLDTSHGAECVEASDVDGDGDEDLAYCTQYGFDGRTAGLRFMRNEKGVLKDRTSGQEIKPIGDIDVAFADVTGDGRKDLIQLSLSRLRVSKWTSAGYRKIYEAKITHAWALAAGDASGDGKADIYVVRGNDKANKADRLLVSRKGGTKYTSVKIPQTTKGSADDVIALDYDRNGHTDFVVLNGRKSAGPVQLLASFPRN